MNELFSREEVLGGLHGSRARKHLFWIEARAGYMVAQARQAIAHFLGEQDHQDAASSSIAELGLSLKGQNDLSVADLERYAPHWQNLVPEKPETRAAIIKLFCRKYKFSYNQAPHIRAALGMDDPAVQEAYQKQHRKPLESVYRPAPAPTPSTSPAPTLNLKAIQIEDIEKELEWLTLERGASLYRQGDFGDSLYILINGRLRAHREVNNNSEARLREIGHNEIVGETSLLAEIPYTETVYAVRDSELIRFQRRSLERLSAAHPAFMMHLLKRLAGQSHSLTGPINQSNLKAITVIPAGPNVPLSDFIDQLIAALEKNGPVLRLTPKLVDDELGAGSAQAPRESAENGRIAGWLSQQEANYNLIIYQPDMEPSAWTARCIRQADRVLIVGQANENPEPGPIEKEYLNSKNPHTMPRQELVLLHPNRNQEPRNTRAWLDKRNIQQHYHMVMHTPSDFERLGRFLRGKAIGIVFSGGVFRGFAHGGVIRALEELNIQPDYVGGTSIGAAIGGLYAQGWSFNFIMTRGREFAAKIRKYVDLTLPVVSLVSSKKLTNLTKDLFGDKQIEDLWIPYFCVSSNLSQAKMMIHRTGPMWRYVRASYSLPTLMPPVPDNGDLLVDGSLFNNLPADTMRDLVEGGPVIAINVSPRKEMSRQYNYDETVSAPQILWSKVNPFAKEIKAPSLMGVIARTISISRDETWPASAREIDLYLEPPVVRYEFGDASGLDAIIEASYQDALEKLKAWHKRLAEES